MRCCTDVRERLMRDPYHDRITPASIALTLLLTPLPSTLAQNLDGTARHIQRAFPRGQDLLTIWSRDPGGQQRTECYDDHTDHQRKTDTVARCRCATLIPQRWD
jgi:hypothetical protein